MARIYTRGGDRGDTALCSGGRVSKSSLRVQTYGALDELNSGLGLAVALGASAEVAARLQEVQRDIFRLSADLATEKCQQPRIVESDVERIELAIDSLGVEMGKEFVLPGGSAASAAIHLARAVCRRAECLAWSISADVPPAALKYLNRLSDYLFVLAVREFACQLPPVGLSLSP